MAGSALLKSVLGDVVNQYAGKSFKKQSVVNALKNRGVKDAELKDSGVLNFIDQAKTDKVQIDDLAKILKKRKDLIEILDPEHRKYKSISTPRDRTFGGNSAIPAYHENIYLKKAPKTEQVKSHFMHIEGAKNYYGHTRSFVSVSTVIDKKFKSIFGIGAKDVKKNIPSSFNRMELITEIQSDKHSPGAKKLFFRKAMPAGIHPVYRTRTLITNKLILPFKENPYTFSAFNRELIKRAEHYEGPDFTVSKFRQVLGNTLFSEKAKQMYIRKEKSIVNLINQRKAMHKRWNDKFNAHQKSTQANFEKDPRYIQNIINNKLVDSYNRNTRIIIFRIGNNHALKRSEGAQKLYDTVIAPSLRKTANKIGAKIFENKTYISLILPTAGFILPVYAEDTNKLNVIGTKNLLKVKNGRQL